MQSHELLNLLALWQDAVAGRAAKLTTAAPTKENQEEWLIPKHNSKILPPFVNFPSRK